MGVMAYSVARRIREIGIRIALGATQFSVAWLILREVMLLALAGLLVGIPLAFALGRATESLLFEVKASGPWRSSRRTCSWAAWRCWVAISRRAGLRSWIRGRASMRIAPSDP